jgi:hypothetical protein
MHDADRRHVIKAQARAGLTLPLVVNGVLLHPSSLKAVRSSSACPCSPGAATGVEGAAQTWVPCPRPRRSVRRPCCKNLKVTGTSIENWKLRIVSAVQPVQ